MVVAADADAATPQRSVTSTHTSAQGPHALRRCNALAADGARELSAGLAFNRSLRTLDLGDNPLGEGGARTLLEAVRSQETLTALDLSCCALGDGGAEALSVEVAMSPHLRFLSASNNQIGEAGGRALAAAVEARDRHRDGDIDGDCD